MQVKRTMISEFDKLVHPLLSGWCIQNLDKLSSTADVWKASEALRQRAVFEQISSSISTVQVHNLSILSWQETLAIAPSDHNLQIACRLQLRFLVNLAPLTRRGNLTMDAHLCTGALDIDSSVKAGLINTFIVSLNIASLFSAKRTSSFFLLLAQYQRDKMATTKELIYQQFESHTIVLKESIFLLPLCYKNRYVQLSNSCWLDSHGWITLDQQNQTFWECLSLYCITSFFLHFWIPKQQKSKNSVKTKHHHLQKKVQSAINVFQALSIVPHLKYHPLLLWSKIKEP